MTPDGLHHRPAFLSPEDVQVVIGCARDIARAAPLATPTMGDGTPLHLRVTNAGAWGWWADLKGYRYVDKHPVTGAPWPAIPERLLDLCSRALGACGLPPMRVDNLLINHYRDGGSLGLHIDRTEDDVEAPIVSLSIGQDAVFLIGGFERAAPTRQIILASGDLLVQSGESRRVFHGIKKLLPTMTAPIRGRINLTFRKVRR